MTLDIPEKPETFVRGFQSPEEMNYWQLKRYAQRVRLEGYDNTRYLVDMYLRTAFPLVILIMTLIGMPLALEIEKGGTALAISLGIAVCFLYVVVMGVSRSLGLSGVLPPVLSAWLANMIFSLVGIYAIQHVQK
jgi:lipopolysaccharide export system permease protein